MALAPSTSAKYGRQVRAPSTGKDSLRILAGARNYNHMEFIRIWPTSLLSCLFSCLLTSSVTAALFGQTSGQTPVPPTIPRQIPVRRLPAGATPVSPSSSTPSTQPSKPSPVTAKGAGPPNGSAGPAPKAVSHNAAARNPVPSLGTSAQEDKTLEAVIRAKLARSKIGKDGLTVRVQGGVAFWEGQTNVAQHKGAATRMARTAGARQVVNNIKISDAARQKAAANLAQGRRRAQVKRGDERSEVR
jgi:hypothetical protein